MQTIEPGASERQIVKTTKPSPPKEPLVYYWLTNLKSKNRNEWPTLKDTVWK